MGDTAEEILAELVACKDLKERIERGAGPDFVQGKFNQAWSDLNAEYQRRKSLAWAAARAHLAAGQAAGERSPPMGEAFRAKRGIERRHGERRAKEPECENRGHRKADRRARAIAEGEG